MMFFFSSRRRHTSSLRDWSSDVCSSDLQAREILQKFTSVAPQVGLLPDLDLFIAHTYEEQEMWPETITTLEHCLSVHTNHNDRPSVMYHLAQAYDLSGRQTNALTIYTNLFYPTNQFTPLARWWVGDYYYRSGLPSGIVEAEKNYQELALTWPGTPLSYEAIMMEGR